VDEVVIRPADAGETETLLAVQREASVAALSDVFPPERYPFPDAAVRERWADALAEPEARVVVAERDGEVLGAALVRPEWLDGLYVVPAWWGRGVAPMLHDEAVSTLRAVAPRAHLWVLEANRRARRFYERRGWVENGRTRVVPFPPHPLDVGYTIDF
jgi:GNAT superfamily N-acetyltransferase